MTDVIEFKPVKDDGTYDFAVLNRELDWVKSRVFIGKTAAFLGSIMASLDFMWTEDVETAATNGAMLWWNPKDFIELTPEERVATIVHELWHPARLHIHRQGTRDPKIWNYACDIRINRDLRKEGFAVNDPKHWVMEHPEIPHELEEDIYDFLVQNNYPVPKTRLKGDMLPSDKASQITCINNVLKAIHQAKIGGQAGSIPGGIEETISKFLAPVVPWETVFKGFFNDMLEEDYTLRRPSRRFDPRVLYLPSRFTDDGRLEHLCYYWDVSGSISEADEIRFNSEVKHIWEYFQPNKLTLVQFDTKITSEQVFNDGDPFDEIKIIGRGGTDLSPVREHIIQHKPTAAVIFSDLYCPPMAPLPFDIPVIWIVVNNGTATVPFGKKLHIKT